MAVAAEFGGAGEGGGTGTDEGYAFAGVGRGFEGQGASIVKGVHGVALERTDLDGFAVVMVEDAGAFAEDLDGAGAGAGGAENVGVENGLGRAVEIVGGDFFDEARDVDVGGAGLHAGRVETEEAAVGFGDGGLAVERGAEVGEARGGGGGGWRLLLEARGLERLGQRRLLYRAWVWCRGRWEETIMHHQGA